MLAFNFSPFPTLATARLTLRQLTAADAPALFELRSDPQVMAFIPRPLATSVADAAAHIELVNAFIAENKAVNWGITRQGSETVIGTIGFFNIKPEHFRAEIGYMLHPTCHGQGLMQEAMKAVLDYGFDVMQLHSVEAVVDPANAASARVVERCRFVKEGHFRESEFWNGKFIDAVFYGLLRPNRP